MYRAKTTRPAIGAVDLFCGAGGLTKGLIEAGIDVRLGIDLDPACRYAYEQNNSGAEFLLADIASLKPTAISSAWRGTSTRILAGCAPCQPFSTYTQGKRWDRADRWGLLRAFSRLIMACEPDIVTMENVASLARQDVFPQFCKALERSDYQVVWDVLDCRAFGIPQSRKRLVLIASRLGRPHLPYPTHPAPEDWVTVRSAIAKLPALKAGAADENDPIHVSSRLTTMNLKRIRASKPGGTWRDWPFELVTTCHTRRTGRTYPAVYGRMEWEAPNDYWAVFRVWERSFRTPGTGPGYFPARGGDPSDVPKMVHISSTGRESADQRNRPDDWQRSPSSIG